MWTGCFYILKNWLVQGLFFFFLSIITWRNLVCIIWITILQILHLYAVDICTKSFFRKTAIQQKCYFLVAFSDLHDFQWLSMEKKTHTHTKAPNTSVMYNEFMKKKKIWKVWSKFSYLSWTCISILGSPGFKWTWKTQRLCKQMLSLNCKEVCVCCVSVPHLDLDLCPAITQR